MSAPETNSDPALEAEQLRAKVKDLSSLIEVSIIINSTVELDELIELVMEKAQSVMRAEASSVMLYNETSNLLECEVALGEVGDKVKRTMQLRMGEGVAGWVAQNRSPEIVPDVRKDSRFNAKIDRTTGFQTKSILAAPLLVKDKLVGVAEVINRRDGKAFNQDDLELFSTFCRQVAMAIENVRMYQIELAKQKLEQQLEAAKFIQQSFMNESFPNSPGQKFAVSAKSLPAASVGGDFYDFIELDGNLIGVAVGDVTGKGVPAALHMARLVSDFRTVSQKYKHPSRVLQALNTILFERSQRGMFVTFLYGILNTSTGIFRYSNAGHIPFIRLQDGKKETQMLTEAENVPLGILRETNFKDTSLQLIRGDCIVLITDGIIEAKNKAGEAYSLEQVRERLSQSDGNVEKVVDDLISDVREFTNGVEQFDDLTILALEWP